MQIKENNFFTTEIPSSEKSRFVGINEEMTNFESLQYKKKPSIRIRLAKSQAKQVAKFYDNALKEMMLIKGSLQRSEKKTHKLREQFMKMYTVKKLKYNKKSLLQQKMMLETEAKMELHNKVRIQRLNNQLGALYVRNEQQARNKKTREEAKKLNEDLRKQAIIKRKTQYQQAKQRYLTIRRDEQQLQYQKRNASTIVTTRAHHNYLIKINNEVEHLQKYTKLLQKVNQLREFDEICNSTELDSLNKTFFVTTKNSFNCGSAQ